MAVARVDEARWPSPALEGIDVVEVGRTVDDAQLEGRDERAAARLGPDRPAGAGGGVAWTGVWLDGHVWAMARSMRAKVGPR